MKKEYYLEGYGYFSSEGFMWAFEAIGKYVVSETPFIVIGWFN